MAIPALIFNKTKNERQVWNRFDNDSTLLAQGGSIGQTNARSENKGTKKPQFSKLGADYLAAVESGDMEKVQRMVNEVE